MAVSYPYQTATEEQRRIGALWWCIHHDTHLEPLIESPEVRARFISTNKPANEMNTRLRNFAPVLHPERLPDRIKDVWAKYLKPGTEYWKGWFHYWNTWAEFRNALANYEPQLMALHCEEYPDTTWNGKSIFNDDRKWL